MTTQRSFTEDNVMTATALVERDSRPASDGDALMALIERAATSADFDVEKMQQVMELKRQWDKDRAAEAYAAALTKFQAKCPTVTKHREAEIKSQKGSSYKYKYAAYEDVMEEIGPWLTECGLALSFSTATQDKGIRTTLKIRHGTHVEEHTVDVPVPAMNVNDTQRYGAALSYAKRYALCAALNIVVIGEDTDAKDCIDPISVEQEIQISELIESKNANKEKFLEWMGVEKISDIPQSDYDKAIAGLRSKR